MKLLLPPLKWTSAQADRERGFTLLETLVAFVVIAVVLGAAYAAIAQGARAGAKAEAVLQALTRAEAALAQVGPEIPLVPSETVQRTDGWVTSIEVSEYLPGGGTQWSALRTRPLLVTVTVSEAGNEQSAVTLEALRLGRIP